MSEVEKEAWYLLTWDLLRDRSDIARAIQSFESHHNGATGQEAARNATQWLRDYAEEDNSSLTRILLSTTNDVLAYYTMSSGEAEIAPGTREKGKWLGGKRVPSSHIDWIARSKDASSGTGRKAVYHAATVALQVAELEGKVILTLDPYDEATSKMWIDTHGFFETESAVTHNPSLRRLYIPIPKGTV